MLAFIAAILIAVSGSTVRVVDDAGKPIAGATVVVHASSGVDASLTSARDGEVRLPSDLAIVDLRVSAPGYETASIPVSSAPPATVELHANVIGRVRVATGSARQAHRLPVPVSTLDGATIANAPGLTTDDLLRDLPGFDRTRSNSAFTNYGQLRVSFSGAGNDRGLVFADGVPAQDGFGGQVDWLAYPPASLASVELLRGSGSALYGANGVGGVLALNGYAPNVDASAPPDGSLDIAAGTPHLGADDLRVRFPLAPHLTAAVVTQTQTQQSHDLTPGYASPIDVAAVSQSSSTRARLRYAFGASALDLGALFGYDAQHEGRPNYFVDRRLAQNDLRFTTTGAHLRLDAVAFTRDTAVTNQADQSPTLPGVLRYTQSVPTRESGTALDAFLSGGENELGLRIDARSVHGNSDQYGPTGVLTAAGSGTQHYAGMALQDTYDDPRIGIIAGVRADTVHFTDGRLFSKSVVQNVPQRNDAVLSPRLALRYSLTPNVALRLSGGGGFREPFLNELVRGYQIGAVSYAPNPALVPERSGTRSIGVDAIGGRQHLSLDVTSTRVTDAITFVTLSPVLQMRENVGRTQADSTTLAYTDAVGRCTNVRLSATTQYARITEGPAAIVAKRLAFVPDRSVDVGVDGGARVRYGFDLSLIGQAYADDQNRAPLGTAVVLGGSVAVPLGGDGTTLALSAANLNGARYMTSVDRYASGPQIALRLRLPIGRARATAAVSTCARISR